ncbi:OmpH family outer membrane protein [uncultured Phascolarctobacterium sp.]|uniref:OmpH family outer membrane protein n=1 Tax=uncultured Phascolarctobacterium sp. TaxID=512296 RepID=UPI0027D941BD|nr:OmpH family outer membrane protein [uncultured Phascolarctobacterium sp.]
MKKQLVAGLMVMVAMLSFGCSGRNAEFGVVDMKTVESKAAIVQTVKEEVSTKGKALQEEMEKEMAGKSQEEHKKILEDKTAEMQLIQSEAQNKLKASLDSALTAVAKEKGLGAVLVKDAVPQGGVDVTDAVVEKMK